jgi:hypothetical protein
LENIENNSFADSGVYYKFDEGSVVTINDSIMELLAILMDYMG